MSCKPSFSFPRPSAQHRVLRQGLRSRIFLLSLSVSLQAPFVEFILHEAITEGTLPNTLDSCMEYWVEVIRWAQYLAPQQLRWCCIQQLLLPPSQASSAEEEAEEEGTAAGPGAQRQSGG